MTERINFKELGLIDYVEALDIQESLFEKKLMQKLKLEEVEAEVLICEHPNVYTIGKSGNENNLLINDEFLKSINTTYHKTNRGGDITYHGPGQLVVYPILDLDVFNIGTKDYIYKLEYSIINVLKKYAISGEISDGNIGVWLDAGTLRERKICSIGVKVSKGITMHGMALNINTDLSYFDHINPCGFTNKGVTSMQKELRGNVDLEKIKEDVKLSLLNIFSEE